MAFGNSSGGPDGQVWSTFSQIGDLKFGIVLAAELKQDYMLTPEKAGFTDKMVQCS